jgi:hypothetical protein
MDKGCLILSNVNAKKGNLVHVIDKTSGRRRGAVLERHVSDAAARRPTNTMYRGLYTDVQGFY